MSLAVIVENVVDGFGRGPLDLVVGVDERQPELDSQAFADRRLAAAHQADEHDGSLAKTLFGDVDGFGFRHLDLEAPIGRANWLVSGADAPRWARHFAPSCHEPKSPANRKLTWLKRRRPRTDRRIDGETFGNVPRQSHNRATKDAHLTGEDGNRKMPSLFRLLFVLCALTGLVLGGLYVLATRFEPEQQTISKPVSGVKIRR